ncbi:hypothetical protein ACH4M4_04610 [Streptomyces sp. NPDC017254]|uniref:hypothetical protein n=1 Tax=unclassified Streptomyces TaxID=2593676 RepID=UPI0037B32780
MARMRAGLVLATVLVAGIAPVAFGGAAAVAAPVTVRAGSTAEPGTVVQDGGRLAVPAGDNPPAVLRLKVTLPQGVTGPVTARLGLPVPYLPGGGTPPRLAARLRTTASADGVALGPLGWRTPDEETEPGEHSVLLDLPAVDTEDGTLTYELAIGAESRLSEIGSIDGDFTVKDVSGTVAAHGRVLLDFVAGTPEPYYRGAVHARDRDGVLWRYEGTGKPEGPLKPRKRVGAGWNVYNTITQLSRTTAYGSGDLVARDKAGVLWYYRGSGDPAAPFKPRVRVGGGWNVYTSLAPYSDGLVARDRNGVLWHYEATFSESPFKAPVRVGGGWNAYTAISRFQDGLVARDKSGVLWKYNAYRSGADPAAPFSPRVRVGGGWNVYRDIVGAMDLCGAWSDSVVARDTTGEVWVYKGRTSGFGFVPGSARTRIGWGWDIYTAVI